MPQLSAPEIREEAHKIVNAILAVQPEQRWELYSRVSEMLILRSQFYQAQHFTALTQAETHGSFVTAAKSKGAS